MKKSSTNAAVAAVAAVATTTTTQQQVDLNNNNVVIDNNNNHSENNNIINNINNDATTTTITATTVEGLYNVIDSKMKYLMIQNRELHQQNVEFKTTIKKQHDFMKIEIQQMKHMIQRLIDGNGNGNKQQQPSGPTAAIIGDGSSDLHHMQEQQPVLANNDDNKADDNDDDGDGDQPSVLPAAVSGAYRAFQLQQQVEEQRLLAIAAATEDDSNSQRSNKTIIDYTTIPYESTLSKHPKDLFQLWREYQYGLEGRKPAKLFTSRERGQERYKYCRRKVIWDKIKEMKKIYKTSHIAIEELYRLYGGKGKITISNIMNRIKMDRRTKNNPLQPSAATAVQQHQQQNVVGGVLQIQQYQYQPVRAIDENEDYNSDDTTVIDDGTTPYEATLTKRPKDLYQLWEEYQYGIAGRKPAKKFTSKERGRVRFKYTRRKIVWDKIKELLKYEGHTYHTAIEEIYRIYGHDDENGRKITISEIVNRMRKDRPPKIKKKGRNPAATIS